MFVGPASSSAGHFQGPVSCAPDTHVGRVDDEEGEGKRGTTTLRDLLSQQLRMPLLYYCTSKLQSLSSGHNDF